MDNPSVSFFKKFFWELLFPSFCLGCQREGILLCQDCRHVLDISQYHYCLCSKPLRLPPSKPFDTHSTSSGQAAQGKCSRCQDKKLSGLYSALPYKEKALTKKLIYTFKERPYLKNLAPVLAGIIIEHLVATDNNQNSLWQNSVLVPIPLHTGRLKERGYNHSEELAKALAVHIKIPVVHGLVKIKETLPQKNLSALQRQANVKNAFIIKNPEDIRDKKVFLVDDVYTTGFTMEECSRVLKESGAKQVWGVTIAREG